jgi:hypothetical protein
LATRFTKCHGHSLHRTAFAGSVTNACLPRNQIPGVYLDILLFPACLCGDGLPRPSAAKRFASIKRMAPPSTLTALANSPSKVESYPPCFRPA